MNVIEKENQYMELLEKFVSGLLNGEVTAEIGKALYVASPVFGKVPRWASVLDSAAAMFRDRFDSEIKEISDGIERLKALVAGVLPAEVKSCQLETDRKALEVVARGHADWQPLLNLAELRIAELRASEWACEKAAAEARYQRQIEAGRRAAEARAIREEAAVRYLSRREERREEDRQRSKKHGQDGGKQEKGGGKKQR